LVESVETARELTIEILRRMGAETEVDGHLEEGTVVIEIRGDREGILIGKHGRTLDSLQVLISRMVNKRFESPIKVVLDVDSYRKKREDALTKMALRMGEKAKRTGQGQTIGPLNAWERRVIHMALKEDPAVTTESLGEGRIKRLSILPKKRAGDRSAPW